MSPDAEHRAVLLSIAYRMLGTFGDAEHVVQGAFLRLRSALLGGADPESVTTAFLLTLERLSPEQRAVLLLRDVFDLPFAELAGILGKSEPACRQLVVRARRQVREERPRFAVDPEAADEAT